MINLVMCSLGGYRFQSNRNPVDTIARSKQYSFASHDRYLGVEASQFKGRKAITITLSIKVFVESESDITALKALETLGDSGKPLKFISFDGGYLGDWVITSFSQNESEINPNMIGIVQTASLTIKEFLE